MRFLGTCAADGMPDPFCDCPICQDARANPAHRRLRSMFLLDRKNLIDCSPDLNAACSIFGEDMMDLRTTHALSSDSKRLHPVEGVDRFALVASPIVAAGDVVGSVMLMAQENGAVSSETEVKLVQTAAAFLGRQMEE